MKLMYQHYSILDFQIEKAPSSGIPGLSTFPCVKSMIVGTITISLTFKIFISYRVGLRNQIVRIH
jgi:hypothetical protein